MFQHPFTTRRMLFRRHLTFLRDKTNGNSHDYSTAKSNSKKVRKSTLLKIHLRARIVGPRSKPRREKRAWKSSKRNNKRIKNNPWRPN